MSTTRQSNWTTVARSQFPWEQDALDFVQQHFPDHRPWQAWANFEFLADDGSVNEVDLLVFSPRGFFLIEIKSRPGRLRGDAGTWTWDTPGKPTATVDNPLFLANSKAKKLRSLLNNQKAARSKRDPVPWIDALVFCSAPDLQCDLQGNAAHGVALRDTALRPGILAAIRDRNCSGLRDRDQDRFDSITIRMVRQAMEQAGIRPSQRSRRVSDYVLDQLIDEGPGYQDWQATHCTLDNVRRRVRIYNIRTSAGDEERTTIARAARREAELLESLKHPGILRREGFTEHELGPALIFEHDPLSIRLDHFLAHRGEQLSLDQRLDLLRQIAEVVRFAHEKRVIHRSLSPRSILVTQDDTQRIQVKLFNWQIGFHDSASTNGASRSFNVTSHAERLVDEISTAYMAPEAITDAASVGEHLDVFSLGAIAWHLFSGQPPASSGLELSNRLRETRGLQISSVLNGAGETLQELIQWSTHPDVSMRLDTVGDFLELLQKVEDEATTPDQDSFVTDPGRARGGDLLPENLRVVRRLGQGACSVVLLVERDGEELILKAASDPDHNQRLRDEAAVLEKLRHNHIVEQCGTLEIGDRFAFLMHPVFSNKEERRIETLRDRLRREGRLHVDLLQRFGEDLLDVVCYLEEEAGIPHRDLKPDNIAIGQIKRGQKLHLVLFDFSLSRIPVKNVRAGTTGYLDPLLPLRKEQRWDLQAERYAAAATLYELAAGPGNLPVWGDGTSDPSHLTCEATLDGDLFDASLRDPLTEFFQRAFLRNVEGRFHNAEDMKKAWQACFNEIEPPGSRSQQEDPEELQQLLDAAGFETQIPELGLGTRATNALDRANILSVEDLLSASVYSLSRLRGVGQKTRREIIAAVRTLRDRLGRPTRDAVPSVDAGSVSADIATLSIDQLAARITRGSSREGDNSQAAVMLLLGLDQRLTAIWPSQTSVAEILELTRGRIGQLVARFQERWRKDSAITRLRTDVAEIIATAGGVMAIEELAEALLIARGSTSDEPDRSRLALAVARACVEVERTLADPRWTVHRDADHVLLTRSPERAVYAQQLGQEADRLAQEDPLVPPARVLQRLREIPAPAEMVPLSDTRLIRLAAISSATAAVSSRQELYPRGMDSARALKLSQGALYGVPSLTVDQIHSRVQGRYPEAAPLPQPPLLDELLQAAGFSFQWDPTARGTGCYVSRVRDMLSLSHGSESLSRHSTTSNQPAGGETTPEIADARQFEERLLRGVKEGSFLALLVPPRYYQRSAQELCARFPVQLMDFEQLFLDALQDVANKARVQWDLVLKTDARPHEGDWDKLMMLVGRAMPQVEQQLLAAERTILLTYPGLLARYEQMNLLERLRDRVGRRDGIPGLWVLVPGDQQALMDGKAVPVISSGQRTRIPNSWLQNQHRS